MKNVTFKNLILFALIFNIQSCTKGRTVDLAGSQTQNTNPAPPPPGPPQPQVLCSNFPFAYDTSDACVTASLANCITQTLTAANGSANCWVPISGWQTCTTANTYWDLAPWTSWSCNSYANNQRNMIRTRSVYCTGNSVSTVCKCPPPQPVNTETCVCGVSCPSNATTACNAATSASCGAPNGTPTPGPSGSTAPTISCGNTILELAGNSTWAAELINRELSAIKTFYSQRGYNITNTRIAEQNPVTPVERTSNYVIKLQMNVTTGYGFCGLTPGRLKAKGAMLGAIYRANQMYGGGGAAMATGFDCPSTWISNLISNRTASSPAPCTN